MRFDQKKQNVIKICKEILTFGDIEIEKTSFCHHKSTILLEDERIEKVWLSKKIFPSEKNYKYFIGYLYNDYKIKPLYIMFPKTSAYVKSYDEQTKWMHLKMKMITY